MSSSVSAIIGVHLKICNVFIVDKLCEFVDNLLRFTPTSITSLIDMENARIVLNVSRLSPKAILNGEMRYCLQVTCEQNLLKYYKVCAFFFTYF